MVSIDAIGCQKTIAAKIKDNLIALKANQGAWYEQVRDLMQARKNGLPRYHTLDQGHGRGEERQVYVSQDIRWVDEAENWPGLKSLVMVERQRYLPTGKVQQQIPYYISSLTQTTPKEFAAYIRGHWGIENGLPWQLDFTFREDHSRTRKDSGPANLHLIRKWALYLLQKDGAKISIKRKRKKASRNKDYL